MYILKAYLSMLSDLRDDTKSQGPKVCKFDESIMLLNIQKAVSNLKKKIKLSYNEMLKK